MASLAGKCGFICLQPHSLLVVRYTSSPQAHREEILYSHSFDIIPNQIE
jgi:hypothetical protein